MKPAQVQSCGYTGIYTQPLLAMGGVRMKTLLHTHTHANINLVYSLNENSLMPRVWE